MTQEVFSELTEGKVLRKAIYLGLKTTIPPVHFPLDQSTDNPSPYFGYHCKIGDTIQFFHPKNHPHFVDPPFLLAIFPMLWRIPMENSNDVLQIATGFWQRLRRCISRRPVMVFMDKLCIAQHDDSLKELERSWAVIL